MLTWLLLGRLLPALVGMLFLLFFMPLFLTGFLFDILKMVCIVLIVDKCLRAESLSAGMQCLTI